MAHRTNLGGTTGNFKSMMKDGFGIVTVMDAKIYKALDDYKDKTAYDVISSPGQLICELDTLKIANVTMEGPTKTVTGGQYSNPLIKFGKSARLEMQDALGRSEAIEALCGGIQEWQAGTSSDLVGLHFGEDFQGPKLIIGKSFFIDRTTGAQVPVNIIFYQFLPDSIFNLTQDAEGDATVFDMNGDLLTTVIKVGNEDGTAYQEHGVFYSIIDASKVTTYSVNPETLAVTELKTGDQAYYSTNGGLDWTTTAPTPETGDTTLVKVENAGRIVWSTSVIKKA